jgi:hypothetical protein
MRRATLVGAVVATAICATSALAGGVANDPLRLVLQRSDFPAKTRWSAARYPSVDKTLAAAGLQGKTADYSAEVPLGSTETLHVSGRVVVLASADQARRLFAQYKRDLALDLKLARIVRLPAYGDDQSAFTQAEPGARADVRVRTGATVWRVQIILAGTEKYTPAQALAQLKTYAAKLKGRVGRG